jgi:hypothetical protein
MLRDKSKIVRGIVRHAKSVEIDIAYPKFLFRIYLDSSVLKCVPAFDAFAFAVSVCFSSAVERIFRFTRDINRTLYAVQQNTQSAGVVAVFVSDQNSVEPFLINTDSRKPPKYLSRA